jgi:hypothetical protein
MEALNGVVAGYVESMRPKGEDFCKGFSSWLNLGSPTEGLADLVAPVHKFAGSAGSAGFMRLSAVATLIEIGLRAAAEAGAVAPLDAGQLRLLGEDFADEVLALAVQRSSLISGVESPVYAPFERPLRIVLAGLPVPTARMLSHVVEQRMGMAWVLPEAVLLSAVPPGRAPDLALSAAAVEGLTFPAAVFSPRKFDDLAAGRFG